MSDESKAPAPNSMPTAGLAAVVVGATGSMGRRIVALLAADPRVRAVTAVGRSPISDPISLFGLQDAPAAASKVTTRTVNYDALAADGTGSDVFVGHDIGLSTMTMYVAQARDEAHMRLVEVTYNAAAARAMVSGGVTRHAFLSGDGANEAGWFMYTRVKGAAERAIAETPGLVTASAARPMFVANRLLEGLSYPGERLLAKLHRWGWMDGTDEADIARAMIHSVMCPPAEVVPAMDVPTIREFAKRYRAALAAAAPAAAAPSSATSEVGTPAAADNAS